MEPIYLVWIAGAIMIAIVFLGDYMYEKRGIRTGLPALIHDIMYVEYDEENEE
jgi:hypothetical protein